MFEQFKKFFRPKASKENVELELLGDDLDAALDTYSELLDNRCRDSLIMDAASERVWDLRARYEAAKLEQISRK